MLHFGGDMSKGTQTSDRVKMNFWFPREKYAILKLICAERGITYQDYLSDLIYKSLREYREDEKNNKRLAYAQRSLN